MLTKKPSSNYELSPLPSAYFANEIEIAFLHRCFNNSKLLNKPFRLDALGKIADTLGINKDEQDEIFQSLARRGLIYNFSTQNSSDYLDKNLDYFLHAEKTLQSFISVSPEYAIGKKLCKFEAEGRILDGGFVVNDDELFNTIMLKVDAYYGEREEQSSYLPSFIRIYECIGTADGRDFYSNRTSVNSSLTSAPEINDTKFNIPKYVVLQRQEASNSWIEDRQKICVCIS